MEGLKGTVIPLTDIRSVTPLGDSTRHFRLLFTKISGFNRQIAKALQRIENGAKDRTSVKGIGDAKFTSSVMVDGRIERHSFRLQIAIAPKANKGISNLYFRGCHRMCNLWLSAEPRLSNLSHPTPKFPEFPTLSNLRQLLGSYWLR
jgi:hypothetical protein